MKRIIEKLKRKWGISSDIDFVLIVLVFSLAGIMVSVCRKPIFFLFGIDTQTPFWIKVLVYLPSLVPLYQIFLIIFGFCFGQFNFFWEKEKKLGRFLLKFIAYQRITPKNKI